LTSKVKAPAAWRRWLRRLFARSNEFDSRRRPR